MADTENQKHKHTTKLLSTRLLPVMVVIFVCILLVIAYLSWKSTPEPELQPYKHPDTWVVSERALTNEERAKLQDRIDAIKTKQSIEMVKKENAANKQNQTSN